MTKLTLKHRIGSYLFDTVRVPMHDKRGEIIRYKNGKPRMRHVESFNEFLKVCKPYLTAFQAVK